MSDAFKRGRLTPDEVETVEQLAQRGLNAGQIALRLSRLPTTISYAMTRLGLRAPVARSYAVTRKGKPVIFFTPDEDALVESMRERGASCQAIADACLANFRRARSAATISLRLKMLANKREAA
ncbi:MAG TPA: helix-turn-helix domain-containing protein [Pseudolabrys sp.]